MLVVDASALAEVIVDGVAAEAVRERMAVDEDHAAPHIVDAEVLGVVRRLHVLDRIDDTAARQAVDDLASWPGERFGHRLLLARAWDLRDRIRTWDALYVVLAEVLGATLLTRDGRLARSAAALCAVEVV